MPLHEFDEEVSEDIGAKLIRIRTTPFLRMDISVLIAFCTWWVKGLIACPTWSNSLKPMKNHGVGLYSEVIDLPLASSSCRITCLTEEASK